MLTCNPRGYRFDSHPRQNLKYNWSNEKNSILVS
jgi:hypothetical protein